MYKISVVCNIEGCTSTLGYFVSSSRSDTKPAIDATMERLQSHMHGDKWAEIAGGKMKKGTAFHVCPECLTRLVESGNVSLGSTPC